MMLDKNGHPSTDASILDDGAVLLPMGLHKGSGLALMMETHPDAAGRVIDRLHLPRSFISATPRFTIALDPRSI